MSVLVVKAGIMSRCASDELNISKKLAAASEEILSIKSGLSFSVRSRAKIDSQLAALAKYCKAQSDNVKSLNKVLTNAVSTYVSTENNISSVNVGTAAKKANNTISPSSSNSKTKKDPYKLNLKDIGKVVGEIGNAGGVIGAICKIAGSKNDFDLGKGLIDLIGKGAKAAKLGETGEKISSYAKWGKNVLTGIEKFFGNYDEFNGDLSNARLWAETAMETALDIGVGELAKVACMALIPGPGWVGAAVGAIVVIGGKYLIKSNTGIDATEYVSDMLLDFGEKVNKVADKASKVIGDGIKVAGKAIAKWFNW